MMQKAQGDVKRKPNVWCRLYAELLDDPKVQRLPPHLFRTWINLLCLATRNAGRLPTVDDMAFSLRVSANDLQSQVDELILAGLIDIETNKKLSPHNWAKRQYVSDTSTARVRKYRETLKKLDETPKETVAETLCETFHVTSPETETESETEKKEEPPTPSRGPSSLECLTAFEAYNATALRCGLPQASKLTPGRARSIAARIREHGPDAWATALANIERSSFLTGGNDRGFRADLDFMLQAKSFARLHDGGYGNGRHAAKAAAPAIGPRRDFDPDNDLETKKFIEEFCQ